MTTTTRGRRALQCLDARLQAHLDDWGNHAPPRRPRLGHTADCPNNGRPMPRSGRCRFCRAEALERATWASMALEQPRPRSMPAEPPRELRACQRCYRPTDDPSGYCGRCPKPAAHHPGGPRA